VVGDEEKIEEMNRGVQDLTRFFRDHQDQLPPQARQRWVEMRASILNAKRTNTYSPMARLLHETFLKSTLEQLDKEAAAIGETPENVTLSSELRRRIAELEAKAIKRGPTAITPKMLRAIVPGLSMKNAEILAPQIDLAMADAHITTQRQRAAFIAQCAHETMGFRTFHELGGRSYFSKYDHRRDLGNRGPPDGFDFRGRGALQLTGRYNYTLFSNEFLKSDLLVRNPALVETPEYAFASAGWYWNKRGLNEPAQDGNFKLVTRRINGGTNGWNDRSAYYLRALDQFAA
jgi:putative chitinase